MTKTQFRRMKVFAIRMARTLPNRRYRKRTLAHVLEILDQMDCKSFSIHYSQIIDWDKSENYTPEEIAANPHLRYSRKNRLLGDWVGHEYGEYDPEITRKTPNSDGCYRTVLANEVACCIRAALDVAVSPSGGVLGWTVGDLRAMWKTRPLPKWVTGFFEGDIRNDPDETPVWL
jgi:hypothetical protein